MAIELRALAPITNDPDEWTHIEESAAGDAITWQSRRCPSCFSKDGGKTYYDIGDRLSGWRRFASWCNWRLPRRLRGTWRFHRRYRSVVHPTLQSEPA